MPASLEMCERISAGVAVEGMTELAAAHASVRLFSAAPTPGEVDAALVAALEGTPDMNAYAAALPRVACAPATGSERTLNAATVELVGDVAWIKPGMGDVSLPAGATAAVIDLRGLPTGDPALRTALDAAVTPALAMPVARYGRRVRQHHGPKDEVFSATNVYTNEDAWIEGDAIAAGGTVDLPIALLTEAVMPPEAVELAGTLRLRARASIFGEDLLAAVAEARWEAAGLAYRFSELGAAGALWPDVVPADRRLEDPACAIESAADVPAAIQPLADTGSTRAPILPLDGFQAMTSSDVTLGAARAALLTFYGVVERFRRYPADGFEDRLNETLADVEAAAPLDRQAMKRALQRLMNALDDGHAFLFDYDSTPAAGFLVVMLEDIDGEAVVRRSGTPGVDPGDTIVSIGGMPTSDWFAVELEHTSAATDWYRFLVAARRLLPLAGPTELGLRDPDGNVTTVTVDPQPQSALQALGFAPSLRMHGDLADLGAPTIHYVNVASEVGTDANLSAALTAAQSASGLVVDMRGYPGVNHYAVAQWLIQRPFQSPQFQVTEWTGPDAKTESMEQYPLQPDATPSFSGPIALLVGHSTVSAAENFSTMLVDAGRVTVVGRTSAGTNGNITGVQLPGAFAMSYTGMTVLHADGSPFHGIGIVPDVPVVLDAAAFRDGIDPELQAAIAALSP